MPPSIKSSRSAWELAASVTGYSDAKEEKESGPSKDALKDEAKETNELNHAEISLLNHLHHAETQERLKPVSLQDTQTKTQRPTETDTERERERKTKRKKANSKEGIDYAKFERLEAEIVAEEEDEKLQEACKRMEPEALKTRRELLEKRGPQDDTSAFFKEAMMVNGCAHDRSKERALFEKPTEEKLKLAKRFRIEGNALFHAQDYHKAHVLYTKALVYFEYTFPENDQLQQELDQQKLYGLLNSAAVRLKLENYKEAIQQCRMALDLSPNHPKAFLRMGQAHLHLDEFEHAQRCLTSAVQNAEDQTIKNTALMELNSLKQKQMEYANKRPEMCRRMFQSQQTTKSAAVAAAAAADDGADQESAENSFREMPATGNRKAASVANSSDKDQSEIDLAEAAESKVGEVERRESRVQKPAVFEMNNNDDEDEDRAFANSPLRGAQRIVRELKRPVSVPEDVANADAGVDETGTEMGIVSDDRSRSGSATNTKVTWINSTEAQDDEANEPQYDPAVFADSRVVPYPHSSRDAKPRPLRKALRIKKNKKNFTSAFLGFGSGLGASLLLVMILIVLTTLEGGMLSRSQIILTLLYAAPVVWLLVGVAMLLIARASGNQGATFRAAKASSAH